MTTRFPILAALLVAGPIATAPAIADSGVHAYTYRGELSEHGSPAQGEYDLRFTLHASPDDDIAIDAAELADVHIEDGHIQAALPFTGVPLEGLDYWVEASVRAAGSDEPFAVLAPRQPLTVPASVKAIGDGTATAGQAYTIPFTSGTLIGNSSVLLGSINVPAGAYVAFVRMQIETPNEVPGNSFRLDCVLSPGFDGGVYRVGYEPNVERYVTFQGASTLANAGAIQFSCRDGNGHTDEVRSGNLTVIGVGAVN